jgi:hypothetical protein
MQQEIDCVRSRVSAVLPPQLEWSMRDGWKNEIESALIDAVFSARARYGGGTTGVRGIVARWRRQPDNEQRSMDDLTELVRVAGDPSAFADTLGNHQLVPGHGSGRSTKASAVLGVARDLLAIRVLHADDVRARGDDAELRRAFTRTKGVGGVTFRYFGILLGIDGVKADVMVRRFVATALDLSESQIAPERAEKLVGAVADELAVDKSLLDHTIWLYERRR